VKVMWMSSELHTVSIQVALSGEEVNALGGPDLPAGQIVVELDFDLLRPVLSRALTNKGGVASCEGGGLVARRGAR